MVGSNNTPLTTSYNVKIKHVSQAVDQGKRVLIALEELLVLPQQT